MSRVLVFIITTLILLVFSWPYLKKPRSHGFFRFFAFETTLALALTSARQWFRQPFSPLQIASWTLLTASLALAIHGFHLLKAIGKPEGMVENTTRLVRVGAYRYIRHPIYSSLLWFGLGALLKAPSLLKFALLIGVAAFVFMTARTEERECLGKFGQEYAEYMHETRMFVPFLF